MIHTKLRRPEEELFRTDSAVAAVLDGRQFDIRKPFQPFALLPPVDWAADPYSDKTWRLYLHSFYWVHAIDETIERHPEQHEELVEYLRTLVMSYVAFFQSNDSASVREVLDDHATAYRLSHIAFAYSKILTSAISLEEKERLQEFAERHLVILEGYLASEKWRYSNHTLFQIEGVLDGALVFLSGEARNRAFDIALTEFDAWLSRVIDAEEGSAAEHAAFYHVFLMARIRQFGAYASRIVGPKRLAKAETVVKRMVPFLWDMSIAPGQFPGFGDSKHATMMNRKYWEEFASDSRRADLIRQLYDPSSIPQLCAGMSAYPKNGYYFVRTGRKQPEVFLSVLDKPFIGPHGHSDGLSFELYARRRPVLVDSGGPYKYGNKLRFQYFRKPIAHNVVVVGDGQQDYYSRVVRASFTRGIAVIKGIADITPKLRWRRALVLLKNEYLLVCDILSGELEGTSAYARFQLSPNAQSEPSGEGGYDILCDDGPRAGARFLSDVIGQCPETRIEPRPFIIEGGEPTSLHDFACITSQDNSYCKAQVLRAPMGAHALHIAVFGVERPVPSCNIEHEGDIRCLLLPSKKKGQYRIRISGIFDKEGRLIDFRVSTGAEA